METILDEKKIKQWGPNLLAMSTHLRNSRLVSKYRGWRPALVLLALIILLMFGFSGGRQATY